MNLSNDADITAKNRHRVEEAFRSDADKPTTSQQTNALDGCMALHSEIWMNHVIPRSIASTFQQKKVWHPLTAGMQFADSARESCVAQSLLQRSIGIAHK